MKKNYIALAIGVLFCFNLMLITVNAVTVIKLTVKVTSVKLSKTNITEYPNKTEILKVNVFPTNATNKSVIWTSSNNKIVSVDKLGNIKTVGVGTAVVTATTVDGGKKATCTVRVVARPVVPSKPVYNGSAIKEKVRTIEGVFDFNGELALNEYGKKGASQFTYFCYNVITGDKDKDINFTIMYSNTEVDKKIRTILNFILPTKGNTLYAILDNSNVKSQTIRLDNRIVRINVQKSFIGINFGPTIK